MTRERWRTLGRWAQFLFIAGAAAAAYSYVAAARDSELRKSCTSVCAMAPDYAGEDRKAPDFHLKTLAGSTFRLSERRGKTVVLVFWNTTCDACKRQMPGLRTLAQLAAMDGSARKIEILAVAVDESAAQVVSVLELHTGVRDPFPVALDPDSKVVLGLYGTKAFPETWVIDPSGTIRMRFDGPRDWSSPVAVDVLKNVTEGSTCPMTVDAKVARGPGAFVCSGASQ